MVCYRYIIVNTLQNGYDNDDDDDDDRSFHPARNIMKVFKRNLKNGYHVHPVTSVYSTYNGGKPYFHKRRSSDPKAHITPTRRFGEGKEHSAPVISPLCFFRSVIVTFELIRAKAGSTHSILLILSFAHFIAMIKIQKMVKIRVPSLS